MPHHRLEERCCPAGCIFHGLKADRGCAVSLDRSNSIFFSTDFSSAALGGSRPPSGILHLRSDAPQVPRGSLWIHRCQFPEREGNAVPAIVVTTHNMVVYSSDASLRFKVEDDSHDLSTAWHVQPPTGSNKQRATLTLESWTYFNLTTHPDTVRSLSAGFCIWFAECGPIM
jgi:hypothetical protein